MKRTLAAAFLCLMLATPTWAGFDEGMAAYERRDYATALREFRPLAEKGDAKAQYNVGLMYHDGSGVPQDYVEAVEWYRKAAEQGYDDAQLSLGLMYREGIGVPQDYVQAHKWFNLAAAQGNKTAPNSRNIAEKKMTPAQLAEAQKLAREWWAAFEQRKGK